MVPDLVFVLVTVCAVLLAGISPLVQSFQNGLVSVEMFFGALGIGALCGMLLGLVLGLFQFQISRGLPCAAANGGIALLLQSPRLVAAVAELGWLSEMQPERRGAQKKYPE